MLHPHPAQYCHIAEEDLPLSECLKDCVAQHAGSAVLAVPQLAKLASWLSWLSRG